MDSALEKQEQNSSMARDQIELTPPRRQTVPEPMLPPEGPDDATSQALSDALKSSFGIVKVLMVGLVILFLCSGIFVVGPQERAIKLRFGRPVAEGDKGLLGPGVHWAYPYPIDEIVRIPVTQVQTIRSTIGWYPTTPAMEAARQDPPFGQSLNPAREGYVLTADGNILHVRGALRFRIKEPGLQYIFRFVEASNLVQNAFNNAIVYAAANYSVDDVLTRDFAGFRDKVRQRLEQLVDRDQLGVVVDQIDLEARPPLQLRDQFNAVSEASERQGKLVNQAKSYESQKINKARSDAAALVANAEADRRLMVSSTAAEAERFTRLLPQYRSNPELLLTQYRTEALRRLLTNNVEKWVLPQTGSGQQIRLQLDRDRPRVKLAPPPVPVPDQH